MPFIPPRKPTSILPAAASDLVTDETGIGQTKVCFCCKQEKPIDDFRQVNRDRRKPGRKPYAYCFDCDNAKMREAHREKVGEEFTPPTPPAPVGQGRCGKCKQNKPISEFCKNKKARSGWSTTCKQCSKENGRKHYLKRTYGIDEATYDAMLLEQGNVCAICHKPETAVHMGKTPRLSVDHDHVTDAIRGLLCYRCNHLVGFIERFGTEGLEAAQQYLAKYPSARA